eukprot:jgi/Bigna1/64470/fgenesh1_kg.76_\
MDRVSVQVNSQEYHMVERETYKIMDEFGVKPVRLDLHKAYGNDSWKYLPNGRARPVRRRQRELKSLFPFACKTSVVVLPSEIRPGFSDDDGVHFSFKILPNDRFTHVLSCRL